MKIIKYDGTNLDEMLERAGTDFIDNTTAILDFTGADLHNMTFKNKNFANAIFAGANLRWAKFCNVHLYYAIFRGAILNGLEFVNCSLNFANFFGSSLVHASFRNDDIRYASFVGANLDYADFSKSCIDYSDFNDAYAYHTKFPYIPMACPETGSFIGYKKCVIQAPSKPKYGIIKLLIPEDAKRSSAFGRKCRCSKAEVLDIQTLDGVSLGSLAIAYSLYDRSFEYRVGETVTPENGFDEDRFVECAGGIHFFLNRQEAVEY